MGLLSTNPYPLTTGVCCSPSTFREHDSKRNKNRTSAHKIAPFPARSPCSPPHPPPTTTKSLPPHPSSDTPIHALTKVSFLALRAGQLHQIRKNLVRLPESGRGTPCGRPPPSCAPLYHHVGAPLVGALPLVCPPLPSRRGTPCGCPSSAIVASQFRCDCPGPPRPSVDKKGLRCSPRPSAPLRGQKEVKVFSAALRGPPWTKRV